MERKLQILNMHLFIKVCQFVTISAYACTYLFILKVESRPGGGAISTKAYQTKAFGQG